MQHLTEDAEELLKALPESGRITNQTAINLTGWSFERLKKAKFELKDLGLVDVVASYGGPFGRRTALPKSTGRVAVLAANESELYEPFRVLISSDFRPNDLIPGLDLFEVIVTGNMRPKDSSVWEIPDVVSLFLKKYDFVPQVVFRTASYELKPKGAAFEPYGVFEAISHSKFGNLTYYCFEWPEGDNFYDNNKYQRIEQEAKVHGIGLIQFWFVDIEKKRVSGKVILPAEERTYDPQTLNNFINRFFPDEVKNRLKSLIK